MYRLGPSIDSYKHAFDNMPCDPCSFAPCPSDEAPYNDGGNVVENYIFIIQKALLFHKLSPKVFTFILDVFCMFNFISRKKTLELRLSRKSSIPPYLTIDDIKFYRRKNSEC